MPPRRLLALLCTTAVSSVVVVGLPEQAAHARGTGEGVTVAIVDTGFDTRHEFFARSRGRWAFSHEVCIDACGPGVLAGAGAAASPVGDRSVRRHGTHVAGVIAGSWQRPPAGRFASLRGTAPGVSLVGVRVFGDDDRGVDLERITAALTWLADQHQRLSLDVVNLSLGGGRHRSWCHTQYPALQDAVTRLWQAGVVVVAGAGNDGHHDAMSAPACLKHVISVAAIDRNGNLAAWSNRSRRTTVAAPGTGVWSAVPGTDAEGRRAAISVDDGTSLAAAAVTGVVALLVQQHPSATPDEIAQALSAGRRRAGGVPVMDVAEARRHLTGDQAPLAAVGARGAVRPSVSRLEPRPTPPTASVPVRRLGAAW